MKREKKLKKIAKEKLPMELMMMEILSRLPDKKLFQFRCVNKTWLQQLKTTVDDPYFSNMQANHNTNNYNPNHPGILFRYQDSQLFYYASDYKPLMTSARVLHLSSFPNSWPSQGKAYEIVAICNGLNPIIQEHITIPSCSSLDSNINFTTTGKSDAVFGFGFHQGTNKYKKTSEKSEFSKSHVSVYTLGRNSTWRILPTDYFYGVKYVYEPTSRTLGSYAIVSFNMKDEFFQEIPQPMGFDYHYAPSMRLGGMGGYLSMKEYGVLESWTKQYVIGKPEIPGSFSWLFLVGDVNDGEIIITKSQKEFILYNPKTNSIRNLYTSQLLLKDSYTYVGSLVSPKVIDRRKIRGTM
ncbi:hypothetical protein AQUCO_03700125v1 [Aquilegia coerulea]|uniref:F-box domain-containing protein n=1 Tax=Aquilegia coerulea TaxID=218851 RepID=A0A2G5CTM4_AQUCA|nr:hypothetical protein AQUCO_03700125v1 [Aquilegia coerulea]